MSRWFGIAVLLALVIFPAGMAWADAEVTLTPGRSMGGPAGSTAEVTASYTILGPGVITDFHLRVELPPHTALKEIVYPPPQLTCATPSATVVDCSAPSTNGISAYGYIELQISIDADTPADTPLPFTFTILGTGITTPLSDRTKTMTTYVIGANDPAATLSAPHSIDPGSTLTATATVTNNGPHDAHGPQVFLTMWNELTPLDITNVTAPAGWTCNGGSKGTPVGCTTDVLPPGTIAVITFSTVLPPSATGSVTSTADAGSWFDINLFNDQPVATTFIGTPPPSADVSVTIAASRSQVIQGDTVTYTVRLSNSSGVNADGAALSLAVSPALPVVSNTMPCSAGPCDMGTILSGESRTFTITVLADQPPGTTVTATATTSATNEESPANNQATATFAVVDPSGVDPNVDLSLTMSAQLSVVNPGYWITFTQVVANRGGSGASGVVVHLALPANVAYIPRSGGCDATECIIGTLAAGESATVAVTALATQLGYGTATAYVTSAETDPHPGDNSASQSFDVTPITAGKRRSLRH